VKDRIPAAAIQLISDIFAEKYPHNFIDLIFKNSGAPLDVPIGTKREKVKAWLMKTNNECEAPLVILGVVLEYFLDGEWNPFQDQLIECLGSEGLRYKRGGQIHKEKDSFYNSLRKSVYKLDLQEVDTEINRALNNVETASST
jgi:hypothetical protein